MFGNYMGGRPDPFKNMMVFPLISWRATLLNRYRPPVGNRLEEFRGKRSKEEERILSGKEEGCLSGESGGRFLAVGFRDGCRRRNKENPPPENYIPNTEKNLCGNNIMFENK